MEYVLPVTVGAPVIRVEPVLISVVKADDVATAVEVPSTEEVIVDVKELIAVEVSTAVDE